MSKPFDATTRELMAVDPGSWLAYLGVVPDGPVSVIDADLATVTAEADKVFRVDGPAPYLVHVEVQSSGDLTLPRRMLRYNALLDLRYDVRVRSVAVLLRPEADRPNLTGILDLRLPDGGRVFEFHYAVARVWQRPVEPILEGEAKLLPMAVLADVPRADVPAVIERIDARLAREMPVATAERIVAAALVLAGLRLDEDEIDELRGRLRMTNFATESSYVRLLLREGREEGLKEGIEEGLRLGQLGEARRLILRLGRVRFGPPAEATRQTIETLTDLDRLEQLSERLLDVSSWDELLAEGPPAAGTNTP
jgi:predicted transposase YdaD